jgi:hypothetical protein
LGKFINALTTIPGDLMNKFLGEMRWITVMIHEKIIRFQNENNFPNILFTTFVCSNVCRVSLQTDKIWRNRMFWVQVKDPITFIIIHIEWSRRLTWLFDASSRRCFTFSWIFSIFLQSKIVELKTQRLIENLLYIMILDIQ